MAMQRVEILGVPVDICRPEQLESEVMELLAKPGTKQIVFLTLWKLLKARNKKSNFALCIKDADLILPVSKSILFGAKFLNLKVPVRYNPFTAVIQILTVLENRYRSLYLLGGRKKTVMQAERNVRSTFPGLQIVGRYVGYYPKVIEQNVVQAIYKASPSLVIVSEGVREKDCWAYNRRNSFSSSIFMYYKDVFGIFSERRRKVSEKSFEKGLEIWDEILHNPFKVFLVFPYIFYLLLLVCTKIFKKQQ